MQLVQTTAVAEEQYVHLSYTTRTIIFTHLILIAVVWEGISMPILKVWKFTQLVSDEIFLLKIWHTKQGSPLMRGTENLVKVLYILTS